MESRGRKEFCLSKRVEEYHYIESEIEESNSEEDVSYIFRILHQKALKKSKQLKIEEMVQNELERRKASLAANYAHQSSQSSNTSEESEEFPICSTIRSNEDDNSNKSNRSEIITNVNHSSMKANSEIFSNYITELGDTFTNGESEKNRNSVKSTIPDLSIDYEVNEELSSMGKHLNDDKYSKIEDDDEMQHSSDQQSSEQHSSEQQEESSNEIVDEEEEDDQIETTKQSDLTSRSTFKEKALSELENTSFSRIEGNCSRISVFFEPSINNSIENHLEDGNRNDSEIVSDDEQQQDGEFKVPRPPKKQIRIRQPDAAIVKKQSKYYETMINKTPTIIYPDNAMNNDEDDEDASIRRSNRIRVRPLEYWRNQKLKYKLDTETKCFTIDGVEKGFKPENPFSKKYTRQPKSNKRKLKQKKTKLPRIKEEDSDDEEEVSTSNEDESSSEEEREPIKRVRYSPNDEESIHQDINESAIMRSERIKREATEFYSKSDLKWNPASQSKGVFLALMNRKKSSNVGTQASGFIKMIAFAQKSDQETTDYITKYVIMFGAVSVQIGGKPAVILKGMDSFTVEKYTKYSIRNLRKDEALLYFDVCRTN